MKIEIFKKLLISNNIYSVNLQDAGLITRISNYEYQSPASLSVNSFILIDDVKYGLKIVEDLGSNIYKVFIDLNATEFPLNESRKFVITDETGVYFWNLYRQAININNFYTIDLDSAFNLILDERYRLALIHGIKVRSPFVDVEGLTIYKRRNVQKDVYENYFNEVIQKRNCGW